MPDTRVADPTVAARAADATDRPRAGAAAAPRSRAGAYAFALAVLVASYGVARGGGEAPGARPAVAFGGAVLALVTFLVAVGASASGRACGVLVNERNLLSLSRLQAAIWTVLLLSGVGTLAFLRLQALGPGAALDIGVDWHLWALVGISTTSLVGTPLLLHAKRAKDPATGVTARTAALTREDVAAVEQNRQGTLYANESVRDARFEDMFEGDEVGNTAVVDIAKVQMFAFTAIAAAAYAASLVTMFAGVASTVPSELPTMSEGLVALLGISHAGYLANKSVDHTAANP